MLRDKVKQVGRNDVLFKNTNAVEALTRARALPSTVKRRLGVTDEILSSLQASPKGELSYDKLIDKITGIGKKLEASPSTEIEGFYDKVLYKLNRNSKVTDNQKIGAEGVVKAVDDYFDDLLKGKKVSFENAVDNVRGTKSYEDINVEIVTFDGVGVKSRIEIKNCDNCVTSDVIKTQFIQRDLYNATDISQIKWKIYSKKYNLKTFKKHLESNKDIIKQMFENRQLPNIKGKKCKSIDELINKLSDDDIYKEIFI